jgi:hypothetical protein
MENRITFLRSCMGKLPGSILGLAVVTFVAFATGTCSAQTTSTTCSGICLTLQNATVPPGGFYQLQLSVTEPKPVGAGSQGVTFSSTVFGTGVGASVNSPSGKSCGVALRTTSGFSVALLSPDAQLGTVSDSPIVAIVLPVRPDAPLGTQTSVNLDPSSTVFLNASGQPYSPLEVSAGTLTIGGTINITSVSPAGVQVPAGSVIAIWGMGFTPSATVDVEGANTVTSKFVSSSEIDITLDQKVLLDGVRVRVRNSTERVMYYPYLHTAEVGSSSNPVIGATVPLFSRVTYTTATLSWSRSGTAFTGLALQNPNQNSAQITLQLLSSSNQVLQTSSVSLAGVSKITEDILDFFPQPPAGATAVHISATAPVQVLGLQGDTAAQTIGPVIVSVP